MIVRHRDMRVSLRLTSIPLYPVGAGISRMRVAGCDRGSVSVGLSGPQREEAG